MAAVGVAQEGPGEALALAMADTLRSVETRLQALEQSQADLQSQRPTWRDVILFVLTAFIAG